MEWLSTIARIVIIIFVSALLAATGYVLWFAITKGVFAAFEEDIMSIIDHAEKNANALGALISREFKGIETKTVSAYKTVAATLVDTANIIKSKGDDTIMIIKTRGDDAISKIKDTFMDIVDKSTAATKDAISTVETSTIDTIEKIKTTTNTSISSIKTAYSTVQTALLDTSKTVSDKSNAIIKNMTDSVRAVYDKIERGTKDTYVTVESTALTGVTKIKEFGANVASTTTAVVNQIKERGDMTINTITNESLAVIDLLRDGTVRLAKQIADDATAAAEKAEALAKETAAKVATGATGVANTVATGATGVANTVATGATGVANTVAGVAVTPTTPAAGAVSGFQNYREGFQEIEPSIVPIEESLVFNLQPLSIKDTGFLGPYPKGTYKEEIATANVLKAGCRFLTLQIDYTDLKMDLSLFEAPGIPTLLMRGSDGKLSSKNSGSINTVATTIANMGFNPIVPNNRQPIFLYLHLVRAPSALNDPDGYTAFLSKIADALNPLAPFHLALTPQGNFTRQKLAEELLTTPMSSLEGQIVIMSNADTSIFRGASINKNMYPPAKDLDFWVNMRVYLDDPNDLNGITQISDSPIPPSAVLVDLNRILSLSNLQKEAFAAKGKRRYVIAMGKRATNPTPTEINIALNSLGVNAIPIDIFTDTDRSILLLSNEYSNKAFRQKPKNLQYM